MSSIMLLLNLAWLSVAGLAAVTDPVLELTDGQLVSTDEIRGLAPTTHPQVSLGHHNGEIVTVFSGVSGRNAGIYARTYDLERKTWTAITRLSPEDRDENMNPALWVDPFGNLHSAWLSRKSRRNFEIHYSKKPEGAAEWSAPVPLSEGVSSRTVPILLGDAEGRVFLCFEDPMEGGTATSRIGLAASDDQGASWRPSDPNYPAHSKKGTARNPVLRTSKDGGLHLIWLDQTPGGLSVVYNVSRDGARTWLEQPVQLNSDDRYALSSPGLLVVGEGLHVSWLVELLTELGRQTEMWTVRSEDGGRSWSENRRVYLRPVTNVTYVLYEMEGTIGAVWGEFTRWREGRILERPFWEEGNFVDVDENTLVAATEGSSFEDLSLISEKNLAVFFSEKNSSQPGRAAMMLRAGGDSAWQRLELSLGQDGFNSVFPIAFLPRESSVYTILLHDVRRRRFLMEPQAGDSSLIFRQVVLKEETGDEAHAYGK